MKRKKTIGIVSHDNRKKDIIEWVAYNWRELLPHSLICTGTTGKLVEDAIRAKCEENNEVPSTVTRLKSGPLGGDQQLGALIAEGKIDILIFFWDPMQPQPHDVDVKKPCSGFQSCTISQLHRTGPQPILLFLQNFFMINIPRLLKITQHILPGMLSYNLN